MHSFIVYSIWNYIIPINAVYCGLSSSRKVEELCGGRTTDYLTSWRRHKDIDNSTSEFTWNESLYL